MHPPHLDTKYLRIQYKYLILFHILMRSLHVFSYIVLHALPVISLRYLAKVLSVLKSPTVTGSHDKPSER